METLVPLSPVQGTAFTLDASLPLATTGWPAVAAAWALIKVAVDLGHMVPATPCSSSLIQAGRAQHRFSHTQTVSLANVCRSSIFPAWPDGR